MSKKEIPEAKSLRWLANMFPYVKNPQDETDKMCNCIHLYCTAGADKIEELNKLAELQTPVKPIYENYDENEKGELIPHKASCPNCEYEFEFGYWNGTYNHHCICGKRIDWEV